MSSNNQPNKDPSDSQSKKDIDEIKQDINQIDGELKEAHKSLSQDYNELKEAYKAGDKGRVLQEVKEMTDTTLNTGKKVIEGGESILKASVSLFSTILSWFGKKDPKAEEIEQESEKLAEKTADDLEEAKEKVGELLEGDDDGEPKEDEKDTNK